MLEFIQHNGIGPGGPTTSSGPLPMQDVEAILLQPYISDLFHS